MQAKSTKKWYDSFRDADLVHQDWSQVLNNFDEQEWTEFISCLVIEKLPFSIPDFVHDSPIICFSSALSVASTNKNSHEFMSKVLQSFCEQIAARSLNTEYAKNVFYLAYATPVYVEDVGLLRQIAAMDDIDGELRAYAARLVASHRDQTSKDWWATLVNNDSDLRFGPIAIDSISNHQSLEEAVQFLKGLKEPSSPITKNSFEIAAQRLLEKIIANKKEEEFSPHSFPDWLSELIIDLATLKEFTVLLNSWFTPDYITSLAEHHPLKKVIKVFKKIKKPEFPRVKKRFEDTTKDLLKKILDSGKKEEFSLSSFPSWMYLYIEALTSSEEFSPLDDLWIRSSDGMVTLIDFLTEDCIITNIEHQTKQLLGGENHEKILRFLESDKSVVVVMGDSSGLGLTSECKMVCDHFVFINNHKDGIKFKVVIYVDSSVRNMNDMLLLVKNTLKDESIKSHLDEKGIINSFKKYYEKHDNKKVLLVIDDFHKKNDQDKLKNFIRESREFCQFVIGINNHKNESEEILIDNTSEVLMRESHSPSLVILEEEIGHERLSEITKCYEGNPLAINLARANSLGCPDFQRDPLQFAIQESFNRLDDKSKRLLALISIFSESDIFHGPCLSPEALECIFSIETSELNNRKKHADESYENSGHASILSVEDLVDLLEKLKSHSFLSIRDELLITKGKESKLSDLPIAAIISSSVSECILNMLRSKVSGDKITEYENKIFTELTRYYANFTKLYGGYDWGENSDFSKLKSEWLNILAILEWNKMNEKYDEIHEIWSAVNRFSDLYGYSEDRLKWLEVLIEYFEGLGLELPDKLDAYVRLLTSRGWSLIMIGDSVGAKETLDKARNLAKNNDVNLITKSYIAHNLCVLYYRLSESEKIDTENNLDCAREMLKEQEKILSDIEKGNVSNEKLKEIVFINCLRDQAKIEFLAKGDLQKVYSMYEECLERSKSIDWKRMISYTHYMLGKTLLMQVEKEFDSEKLHEVRQHISEGIRIAEENNNRRRIAYFKELSADWLQLQSEEPIKQKSHKVRKEAESDFLLLGVESSWFSSIGETA